MAEPINGLLAEPLLPSHIDSTMMTSFRSCEQKFYNEFILGLRIAGKPNIHLHAGACFASAIEATYRAVHERKLPLPEALAYAFAVFSKQWGDYTPSVYDSNSAKTMDRMWTAVEDYFATYPPLTDHVQPYFNAEGKPTFEFTFAIPLEPAVPWIDYQLMKPTDEDIKGLFPLHPVTGEPFMYVGRFDMLGSYEGRPCVRDEKTTGRSPSTFWADSWNLRNQFIGYVWACQNLGFDLDTVVVRGVGILKTKIAQAEAIKTYPDFLVERWHEQLRTDLWRLVDCWQSGKWRYDFGNACTSYGTCTFMPLCMSRDPRPWMANFSVVRWNPLTKDAEE